MVILHLPHVQGVVPVVAPGPGISPLRASRHGLGIPDDSFHFRRRSRRTHASRSPKASRPARCRRPIPHTLIFREVSARLPVVTTLDPPFSRPSFEGGPPPPKHAKDASQAWVAWGYAAAACLPGDPWHGPFPACATAKRPARRNGAMVGAQASHLAQAKPEISAKYVPGDHGTCSSE